MSKSSLPPSTNRGVTVKEPTKLQAIASKGLSYIVKNQKNEKTIRIDDFLKPKFDWFEGRFKNQKSLDDVYPILMPYLDGEYSEVWTSLTDRKLSPVQRGYSASTTFYNADNDAILTLSYGGQNAKYGVYFKTTGRHAPHVMQIITKAYGITYETARMTSSPILCTRVDVAVDFRLDNAKAFRVAGKLADKLKLKTDCAGSWRTKDPVSGDAGRTLYIKEASNCKIRLYEKSKEQIHKYGLEPGYLPEDWLRFEVQYNAPSGSNAVLWKAVFSNLTPDALIGTNESAVKLINALTGIGVNYEKIQTTVHKKPLGIEATLKHLTDTYYGKLQQILGGNLGYELVVMLFGDDYNALPPLFQSQAMRHYLAELEFQAHGDF